MNADFLKAVSEPKVLATAVLAALGAAGLGFGAAYAVWWLCHQAALALNSGCVQ